MGYQFVLKLQSFVCQILDFLMDYLRADKNPNTLFYITNTLA